MTLRKCIFDIEYYSERGLRISEPPLKLSTSPGITLLGLLHFNQNERTGFLCTIAKNGLA
jgi:hypothetical protein